MPRDAAQKAIYGEKMDDILDDFQQQKHWTKDRVLVADTWYRNFLWLSYLHLDHPVFAIYKDSDDLWHAHMLYTKRYREFVVPIFGQFLNHTPIVGRVTFTDVEQFDRAMNWYDAEFGRSPLDVPVTSFVTQCY